MAGRSQSQRILWLLAASFPSWTPAPELGKISLQFCTRIFELRRAGWLIENRLEQEGTKKRSFYRLGAKPHPQRAKSIPQPMRAPASLFGDISPDRSYRE